MKRELVGWPSVVSDDLVQSVDQKLYERWRLQFQKFGVNFYKFHAVFHCEMITVMLGCHKFCARWVPKMLMGVQRMASALTFLD
jgi:hypothetical protein